MKIKIIPTWYFLYDQIADPTNWRKVDFQKDDGNYSNTEEPIIVCYVCFGFPPKVPGIRAKLTYQGKYIVRKIDETFNGFPGIEKGWLAFTLEEFDEKTLSEDELKKMKTDMTELIKEYENGKDLPYPL